MAKTSQVKIMDRYLLKRLIGGGGMGRVWLARDERLLRDVAIKQVWEPPELSEGERERMRRLAIREAQAASQINHANAVRIYDVFYSDYSPWIVMEYVPSVSLLEQMKRSGRLAPGYVAIIGVAVLDALTAAHRVGVMHRDVTPQNILIGEDGRIVLTDFGLASWNPYDGRTLLAGSAGTPLYLAPERVRSGRSIPEGDMWSLGATLYAAVEGKAPHARGNVLDTLAALVSLPPDPARFAGPLTGVLCGLLQQDPKLRLNAPETRRRLLNVIAGRDEEEIARRAQQPKRQRLQSAPTVCLAVFP